jgi:S1-C subfamily serine protease
MTTMEDLTKTQIILLTLLVSFITSIATGIITSTLLAQAPASVTQTIDRVVEHTIEQVTPSTAGSTSGPTTTVHDVTVVKEDDAIVGAVATAAKSLVRIKEIGGAGFYALGAIVSKEGLVLTDSRDVIADGIYTVVLPDGSTLQASVIAVSNASNIALFKLTPDAKHPTFTPIPIAENDAKLGQTVIALEGDSKNSVAIGRVLSSDASSLTTDINPATETRGGPLVSLTGALIGIKNSRDDLSVPPSVYLSLAPIQKFLTASH